MQIARRAAKKITNLTALASSTLISATTGKHAIGRRALHRAWIINRLWFFLASSSFLLSSRYDWRYLQLVLTIDESRYFELRSVECLSTKSSYTIFSDSSSNFYWVAYSTFLMNLCDCGNLTLYARRCFNKYPFVKSLPLLVSLVSVLVTFAELKF